MKILRRTLAAGLALAMLTGAAGAVDPHIGPYYYGVATLYDRTHDYQEIDAGKSFAVAAGILKGDQNGDLRWMDELTRAEAATMILRLMGMEEEAQAAAGNPSPFTDVPAWANGYVNLAYEKGIVNGVGGGRFAPEELCGARDFVTMLYRLTHLEEGTDYTWATSVYDLEEDIRNIEDNSERYDYFPDYAYFAAGEYFRTYSEDQNGPFTREVAAEALYIMLSIDSGGGELESLADILVEDYGLSSLLCYNYTVRRSPGDLMGQLQLLPGSSEPMLREYTLLHAVRDPAFYEQLRDDNEGYFSQLDPDVEALAQELTQGLTSQYEKAEAISRWIHLHIYYDQDSAGDLGKRAGQDAGTVLDTRKAVCEGFANLTAEMLRAVGIECLYQSSIRANHAWNVANIDGQWIFIDNVGATNGLIYEDGQYFWNRNALYGGPVSTPNYLEPGADLPEPSPGAGFDVPIDEFYTRDLHELDRDFSQAIPRLPADRFWDPNWTANG